MVTWREVSARRGRNDLPGLLVDYFVDLEDDDIRTAVHEAWTMAEWPEQHIDQDGWCLLFDLGGYQVDGEPAEQPTEFVTLYRGAIEERRRGMSWTGSREKAEWFAQRFAGMIEGVEARVWRATVPGSHILARFHERRGEDEYVVDTRDLHDEEWEDVTDDR